MNMNMKIKELRKRLQNDPATLYSVAKSTGIDYSTLWRFMNGRMVGSGMMWARLLAHYEVAI